MAKKGEIDPWKIDIVDLTDKFLKKIEDLRLSGRIILYASILLRMKSEILLREIFGSEEEEEQYEIQEFDLDLDFEVPIKRSVKRFTTLDELINELRRIERRRKRKKVDVVFERFDEVPHEEDIEEKIMEVYMNLLRFGKREISFFSIVKDFDKPEKLKYYLSILHLAFRGKIEVRQERLYGDIRVILNEEGG